MQEIWIDIDERGNVRIEGKSADLGSDCKALTAEIEAALGSVTATKIKPEFHRARTVAKTVKA